MTNGPIVLDEPMLKLSFGGATFLLPWATGVQVLNLMKDAVGVTMSYEKDAAGSYQSILKTFDHKITAESSNPTEQAMVLLGGRDD